MCDNYTLKTSSRPLCSFGVARNIFNTFKKLLEIRYFERQLLKVLNLFFFVDTMKSLEKTGLELFTSPFPGEQGYSRN